MQALGELTQLPRRRERLLARHRQPRHGPLGVALQLAQREVQRLPEHDQPLLRAVVQVPPDPRPLLVGGRDQRLLVTAPLELRARPRGEHAQRLQLLGLRVQRPGGDHADVADRLAARVVQRDREVAVQRVSGEERVFGIALAGALGHEQQARAVRVLARRAGQLEHVVRTATGQNSRRCARDARQQFGDERHLGTQRTRELGHEPAQELLPDDARGAGREAGEKVEFPERGHARRER